MTKPPAATPAAPAVSPPPGASGRHHAFISYARRPSDQRFVDELCRELEAHGKDVWVDRSDIPPGADWLARISKGIEAASSLIFVLSPSSAASKVCQQELEIALEQNKRVIPILHEAVDANALPPALARLNWISFTERDDHDHALTSLLEAIDTDLEWRDAHARLSVRASEWAAAGGDRSFLLRGRDLRDAEAWYAAREGHREAPTAGQLDYILASRRAASRRQRVLLGAVSTALAVAVALAVYALIERGQAVRQATLALGHQLASEAGSAAGSDVRTESLLALEAFSRAPTVTTARSALVGAAEQPLVATMAARSGEVESIAYSRDGRTIAAATREGIQFWSAASRLPEGSAFGPGDANGVAFSPRGDLLAVAAGQPQAASGTVDVYRFGSRVPAHRLTVTGVAATVAFAPSGQELAIGTSTGAIGSRAGYVYLWNLATGAHSRILVNGGAGTTDTSVLSVAFARSGATVAAAGATSHGGAELGFVRLYGAPGLRMIAAHALPVAAAHVTYAPDRPTLALALDNDSAVLLNARTLAQTGSIALGNSAAVVAYNRTGTLLATGDYSGAVRLWNPSTQTQVGETMEDGSLVYGLAFAPDGRTLCAGGLDGGLFLWNSSGLTPLARVLATGAQRGNVAVDSRATEAVTVDASGQASAWRIPGGARLGVRTPKTALHSIVTSPDSISRASAIAIDPAGVTVAIGLADGDVLIADRSLQGGHALPQGKVTLNGPATLAFSADGHMLAAGDLAGDVVLWRHRAAGWGIVGTTHVGSGGLYVDAVSALAFDRSGRTLAVGTETATDLLDTGAPERPARLVNTREGTFSLAFAPDGQTLYEGDNAGDVELFKVAAAQHGPFATLPGGGNAAFAVAISPDARTLAAADSSGVLRLWDLSTREQLGLALPLPGPAVLASFTPHSALVTGDQTGAVIVWPSLLLADTLPPFAAEICPRLAQNLSEAQWRELVGDQPYRATCRRN